MLLIRRRLLLEFLLLMLLLMLLFLFSMLFFGLLFHLLLLLVLFLLKFLLPQIVQLIRISFPAIIRTGTAYVNLTATVVLTDGFFAFTVAKRTEKGGEMGFGADHRAGLSRRSFWYVG